MNHPSTLAAALQGLALGLSLIVAIGAQNAFVLRQGLRREHVGPVVWLCALSDWALIALGVSGVARALGDRPGWLQAMALGGAVFLASYGVRALMRARQPQALQAGGDAVATTLASCLAQAAAFTWLNPHVYLDTVLLMGSVGAQQAEALRPWFIVGAGTASLLWFGGLGYGARWLAPWFARPRAWQVLDGLIGVTMLAMAAALAWQGWSGWR